MSLLFIGQNSDSCYHNPRVDLSPTVIKGTVLQSGHESSKVLSEKHVMSEQARHRHALKITNSWQSLPQWPLNILATYRGMVSVPICELSGGRPGGYTTGTSWKIWGCQTKDTQEEQIHSPSGTPRANPIPSTHTSILLPIAALMATEQCWTHLFPEAPSSSSLLIHQPKLSLSLKQTTSGLCALIAAFSWASLQILPALTHTDISTQLPPQPDKENSNLESLLSVSRC